MDRHPSPLLYPVIYHSGNDLQAPKGMSFTEHLIIAMHKLVLHASKGYREKMSALKSEALPCSNGEGMSEGTSDVIFQRKITFLIIGLQMIEIFILIYLVVF